MHYERLGRNYRNYLTKCVRRRQQSRDGSVNRVPYISGSDYPNELHVLLKNEVMIRRLKKNVVDQLPPLRYCATALCLDIGLGLGLAFVSIYASQAEQVDVLCERRLTFLVLTSSSDVRVG